MRKGFGSFGRRVAEDDDLRFSRASRRVAIDVLVQFAPTLPEPFAFFAHRGPADYLVAGPPASSTTLFGCACRFSHHAGSAAPQPFMAIVTMLGPSS